MIKFDFCDKPAQYGMNDEYHRCKGSEFYATLWAFASEAALCCKSNEISPPIIEFSWKASETLLVWRNVLRVAYEWYAEELPIASLRERHREKEQKLTQQLEQKNTEMKEELKLMQHVVDVRNGCYNGAVVASPLGLLNVDIDVPVSWFLYDVEWHVVPNQTNHGVGDLVFANTLGMFVVVEVKSIKQGTGHTARTKRTQQRKELPEQAQKYADCLRKANPRAALVLGSYFTNEQPHVQLIDKMDEPERRIRVAGLIHVEPKPKPAPDTKEPTPSRVLQSPTVPAPTPAASAKAYRFDNFDDYWDDDSPRPLPLPRRRPPPRAVAPTRAPVLLVARKVKEKEQESAKSMSWGTTIALGVGAVVLGGLVAASVSSSCSSSSSVNQSKAKEKEKDSVGQSASSGGDCSVM
jgi:hypothetical protein